MAKLSNRVRILTQSVAVWSLLLAGLFVELCLTVGELQRDYDIGYYVRSGWLAVHHWTNVNTLTWIGYGLPLSRAEWLAEVIYSELYTHFGLPGLILACKLALVLILGITLRTSIICANNSWVPAMVGVMILIGVLVVPSITARSQIFTYLFLALYFLFRDSRRWIWFILVPLWANLHGEYAVFIVIYCLDQLMVRNFRALFMVPIWLIEVVLFTPRHLFTLLYPVYTLMSSSIHAHILEWQGFQINNALTIVELLVGILAGISVYRHGTWRNRILLFLFGFMALDAIRNIVLYGLFVAAYAVYPSVLSELRFTRYQWVGALFLIPAFWTSTPHVQLYSDVPRDAVAFVDSHSHEIRRWYMPTNVSGVFELQGNPVLSYIDDRTDLFVGITGPHEPNVFEKALEVGWGELPIQDMPSYSSMQGMWTLRHSPLDYELRTIRSWRLAYRDSTVDLFLRTS